MADPAPPFTDRALEARIERGWRLRLTDVPALVPLAAEMRAAGAGQARAAAWADLFEAWGVLGGGRREDCGALCEAAAAAMQALDDCDGLFACRQLQAYLLLRDGDAQAGMAASAELLARPEDSVSAPLRYNTLSLHSLAAEALRRHDETLQLSYAALAVARRMGDPVFVAHGASTTGGLQSSLLNLEDALPLCDEAWQLCEPAGWSGLMAFVGPNRMMVLAGLGRLEEARALAEVLLRREAEFPPRQRVQRHTLYGTVLADAGDLAGAQALLDLAQAHRAPATAARAEWVWTQARVWNRQGRHAEALALLQPYLDADAAIAAARIDRDYPIDDANMAAEAAVAHEALGHLAAALRCERLAAAARQQALQRTAHARRVTLQIDHELDSARRQRDHALREQDRLVELNRALRSADEAKTRFLAAASHDLRQPVHALGLQLATLRERSGDAAVTQRMEDSVRALGALFDALLDLSQIDAGVTRADPQATDLRPLLVRLADEMTPHAGAKGLRLLVHLPRETFAGTDALLLERVLRNLLDNAIKYTARGGVLLALRPRGNRHWALQVLDTGQGIAPEHQARVFDEFHQLGNPGRDRRQGLGLGLAIVRRLCALLGHEISLRSRPGRGSRFTLLLPREPGPAAQPPRAAPHGAEALCIAVVEDDLLVRQALRTLLEQWGHRVVDGDSAAAVLAQCGPRTRPDAVVADLRLPGGRRGDEEAAALAEAFGRTLPTLVVTGDTAPDRLRALEATGLTWLAKPVAPLRLRSWLAGVALAAA